jgi:hypothetical protein
MTLLVNAQDPWLSRGTSTALAGPVAKSKNGRAKTKRIMMMRTNPGRFAEAVRARTKSTNLLVKDADLLVHAEGTT